MLWLVPASQLARRSRFLRGGICGLAAIVLLAQLYSGFYCPLSALCNNHLTTDAANSTLGFGGIYAVSRADSPRKQSLLAAAQLTKLEITVPDQPQWRDEDVQNLKATINSTLKRGSAYAWLGHLNALAAFLETDQYSALIIEDDTDWDTRLRSQQIPQIAYAIRELVGSHDGYYGQLGSWDIVWLGHCGDYFDASRGSSMRSIKSFLDPAMPNFHDLHPWTQAFMVEIGAVENQRRLVHESVRPLCTFAYAVTRSAAERVLYGFARQEPVRDAEKPCEAYDVRLLEGCRDEGLKCISVNPEIFHHSNMGSEIAQMSDVGHRELGAVEDLSISPRPSTTNIRCSARSRKWDELRHRIAYMGTDVDDVVRGLAETPNICYIDDIQ